MENKRISKKIFIGIFAVLVVCFIIGIFFDLDFSKLIFNYESIYAMIFASFAPFVPTLIGGFAFCCSIKICKESNLSKSKKIISLISGALVLFYGAYQLMSYQASQWNGFSDICSSYVVYILVSVFTALISFLLSFKFFNTKDYELIYKIQLVCLFTCVLELIVINIIKPLWSRPRFRLIHDGKDGYPVEELFRRVYEPSRGIAGDVFADAHKEQFKSFPSGHSSTSYTSLLLFYVPYINNRSTRKTNNIFLFIGLAWGVLVQFSRIVQGAHYITDVTMGALICTLIHFIVSNIILKDRK